MCLRKKKQFYGGLKWCSTQTGIKTTVLSETMVKIWGTNFSLCLHFFLSLCSCLHPFIFCWLAPPAAWIYLVWSFNLTLMGPSGVADQEISDERYKSPMTIVHVWMHWQKSKDWGKSVECCGVPTICLIPFISFLYFTAQWCASDE